MIRANRFARIVLRIARATKVQEMNGVQSWISPPPLMAPKHCRTSILGAMIVFERGFLEAHYFPERRVVGPLL